MKRLYRVAAIVIAVLLLAGVFYFGKKNNELQRYEAQFLDVFDTVTEITAYGKNQKEFSAKAKLIYKKLKEYNRLFDIYNNYEGVNNIKTINDNAGIAPVKVDREIIQLLKLGKEMHQATGGKINIALGSVLQLWHTSREEGLANPQRAVLPKRKELERAAKHVNIEQMMIDEKKSTVYLDNPDMSLDVGSIGKGYAVQKAAEYAKEIGMDSILFNVGGNVCALGTKPDGTAWTLGIQNPDTESKTTYLKKVAVEDKSVVTSGNYQRYYTVDGADYCHIIDPETLMPGNYCASVTIIAPDSGIGDALSTAIYNMPYKSGREFIECRKDTEAIWIFEDGSIKYSSGFKKYLLP